MTKRVWGLILVGWALAMLACSSPAPTPTERVSTVAQRDVNGPIELKDGTGMSGFSFIQNAYYGNSGGDFYFTAGQFWSNNVGQRGVINVGACSSVDAVTTIPTTGYSIFGVTATVGNCYVVLTAGDERDHGVIRVELMGSNWVMLTWDLVTSSEWGATLTSNSSTTGGYDFDTRTYTGTSGGDFYFVQGDFWANNTGQRGVASLGACSSVEASSIHVPMAGYSNFAVATAGNCYVALGHNEEHGNILFSVDAVTSTTVTLTFKIVDDCYGLTSSTYNQNVNCWLTQNTGVSQYVIWENRVSLGNSTPVPWSQWTNAHRDDLRNNVVAYENLLSSPPGGQDPDPLVDPPTNQLTLMDTDIPVLVLSFSDAWRLYVKEAAMSLAVELSSYVPWSVTSYSAQSLSALFDSRNTLTYSWSGGNSITGITVPQVEGYVAIDNTYDAATHTTLMSYATYATPAPPDKTLAFIRAQSLQGSTRVATITNTVSWARRLFHFNGGRNTQDFQEIWGYRGPAPVSATITGTVSSYPGDPTTARHYTAGCHGTAVFLNSVLRTINIPVDANERGTAWSHSTTRFMTDGIYLAHGDDPYYNDDIYDVAPASMLLSEATYESWFLTSTNPPTELSGGSTLYLEEVNHGDEAAMLAVGSPLGTGTWLKHLYCLDPAGTAPANSMVMTAFSASPDIYSVSYLQNLPTDPSNPTAPASLWDRLAQAISAAGGCTATESAYNTQYNACTAVTPASEQLRCTVK